MFVSQSLLDALQHEVWAVAGTSERIKNLQPVSGGDINQAFRIITERSAFFVKVNTHTEAIRMFTAESLGLARLRRALPTFVPAVLSVGQARGDAFLLMEWIESAARTDRASTQLGTVLATLHRERQTSFGLDHDNFIGTLPQRNTQHDDWSTFFIRERLDIQVRTARAANLIDATVASGFEKLYKKLADIFPEEAPALLHGDLWAGNWIVRTDGTPLLIDPAIYCGHREADIAMTRLFGGFGEGFYLAYDEAFPLAPGWQARVDLYNLYPLLVHLNLFGHAYLPQIDAIVRRFS